MTVGILLVAGAMFLGISNFGVGASLEPLRFALLFIAAANGLDLTKAKNIKRESEGE